MGLEELSAELEKSYVERIKEVEVKERSAREQIANESEKRITALTTERRRIENLTRRKKAELEESRESIARSRQRGFAESIVASAVRERVEKLFAGFTQGDEYADMIRREISELKEKFGKISFIVSDDLTYKKLANENSDFDIKPDPSLSTGYIVYFDNAENGCEFTVSTRLDNAVTQTGEQFALAITQMADDDD
jgi:hypothetical protein